MQRHQPAEPGWPSPAPVTCEVQSQGGLAELQGVHSEDAEPVSLRAQASPGDAFSQGQPPLAVVGWYQCGSASPGPVRAGGLTVPWVGPPGTRDLASALVAGPGSGSWQRGAQPIPEPSVVSRWVL